MLSNLLNLFRVSNFKLSARVIARSAGTGNRRDSNAPHSIGDQRFDVIPRPHLNADLKATLGSPPSKCKGAITRNRFYSQGRGDVSVACRPDLI
jgi:endonuclease I